MSNSLFGSKLFLDTDIPDISDFKNKYRPLHNSFTINIHFTSCLNPSYCCRLSMETPYDDSQATVKRKPRQPTALNDDDYFVCEHKKIEEICDITEVCTNLRHDWPLFLLNCNWFELLLRNCLFQLLGRFCSSKRCMTGITWHAPNVTRRLKRMLKRKLKQQMAMYQEANKTMKDVPLANHATIATNVTNMFPISSPGNKCFITYYVVCIIIMLIKVMLSGLNLISLLEDVTNNCWCLDGNSSLFL